MGNLYMPKKLLVGAVLLSLVTLSGCVSAPIVLASAGGTAAASSAGSSVGVPQQFDDLTIRSKIYTILNNTPNLNGANVEVTVFNGIVLLLGQISSNDLMQQIVSQTSAIPGVVVVYNQMTVGPNEPLSVYTNDSWITSKVIANITKKVNPLHFKVVTQNGVVYLLGQVTHNEADLAVQQASQVTGVKSIVKIFNYINPTTAEPEVVPVSPSTAAPSSASTSAPATAAATSNAAPAAATSAPASAPAAGSSTDNGGVPQYAPTYGPEPATASGSQAPGPAASD
jgi:osmotically-inducible protein OsmY